MIGIENEIAEIVAEKAEIEIEKEMTRTDAAKIGIGDDEKKKKRMTGAVGIAIEEKMMMMTDGVGIEGRTTVNDEAGIEIENGIMMIDVAEIVTEIAVNETANADEMAEAAMMTRKRTGIVKDERTNDERRKTVHLVKSPSLKSTKVPKIITTTIHCGSSQTFASAW